MVGNIMLIRSLQIYSSAKKREKRPNQQTTSNNNKHDYSNKTMMNASVRIVLCLLWTATTAVESSSFGLQTGIVPSNGAEDQGSSYGGSMQYDSRNQVLFVTGSTYGSYFSMSASHTPTSNCFLGVLSLEDNQQRWLHTSRFGTTNVPESCSAMTMVDVTKLYLGGQSQENGFLTGLRPAGSNRATQYGFVGDVDVDLRGPDSAEPTSTQFRGGRLIHSSNVQTVSALATNPRVGSHVFVASHETDSTTFHATYNITNDNQPNFSTGGVTKYGQNYFVNIMRFPVLNGGGGGAGSTDGVLGQTLGTPSWVREIATAGSVDVAGLLLLPGANTLLLAGTAEGSDSQAIPPNGITLDTDYDGFVTLFDPANGFILGTLRFESQRGKQDRVEAVCVQEGPNPEYAYLVGSTTGIVDMEVGDRDYETYSAFVTQISLPALDVLATKQIEASFGPLSTNPTGPQMRGLACAVTSDGSDVYIGGVVEEGNVVRGQASFGRDDIFVAQYNVKNGNFTFVKQLGSTKDDALVDIVVDKDDNAIVLGNTRGSLLRPKSEDSTTSDVFIMSFARNTGFFVTSSTDSPGPQQPTATQAPIPNETPSSGGGGGRGVNGGLVAVLVVLSVCGVLIGCFFCRRNMLQDIYTDRDQVLEYLKGFDDVEVDLKHSATGGWHGTYINHDGAPRYFNDRNMPDTITFSGSEMSPLTHNEIVRDSLFTDDYEEDLRRDGGGGGPGSSPGSGSGAGGSVLLGSGGVVTNVLECPPSTSYGGLVDAYNTTWDDMNPYALPGSRSSVSQNRASVTSSAGTPRQSYKGLQDININEDQPWGEEEEEDNQPWGNEII